ncbi:MAG: ATP-dependent exoDNAse (exonuclease V) beta subunit [Crocinitomicaceae bacterium]|jgi:ATP-dependent exoDNAse (exonuclease V) beta subunit
MTFTNKAALEMKERIISALDQISREKNQNSGIKILAETLATEIGISPEEVNKRSKKVLESILHQYEDFNVMTIDKFNLRLIKSFARDLDLPSEFEVVLDETEIIEKIVDDLLNQLGNEEQSALSQILMKYAKSNIDDGDSWNFRRSLIDFGKVLRNEKNNASIERLMELNLSIDVHKELYAANAAIDKKFKGLCASISEKMSLVDPSVLPGKKSTFNQISTILRNEKFPLATELVKKQLSQNLEKDFPDNINRDLLELNAYWEKTLQDYGTVHLFLNNFFNMALLQYMAKALETTKREEQIIRISEFNTLISDLIQDENAPFIYERLGTRFKHFLLDEFQDTSHLQWLNLVPLIHESIGNNLKNLIVGDPKQSIYRFKNGIAEQFVELPQIHNPDKNPKIERKSQFFKQMGSVSELGDNWRSSPSIVNFNNSFFEDMKTRMPEDSRVFYNSISQIPKSSINGKVQISSEKMSKDDKVAVSDLLPTIIDWIEECKQDGFKPADICILGGRNKECNAWAVGLNDAGYRVVSADSLLIHSNLKVQLCIAFLKWRLRPSGENEKKRFAELFFRNNSKSYDDYKQYIKERELESGRTYRYFDDRQFLTDHFESYSNFFFKYENIYDLIQGFYRIIHFKELQNPYLHHLADIIYDFGLKRGPNLKAFLDEYHRKKDKIAVQIPEAEDAIKIMTIHKSKGLEFPVVLIPTLNFSMKIKSSFLVGIDNFIVYKQPTQSEVLQPLIDLYNKEMNQIITDNVNLCYVAMTRPVERLYIQNDFESTKFGELFHETLLSSGLAQESDGKLTVTINDGDRSPIKQGKELASLFEPDEVTDRLWFPDIAFQDNPDLNTADFLSDEMQFGIQFHLLTSRIETLSEIEEKVDEGIHSGEVSVANSKQLIERLTKLYNLAEYQSLISNNVQVLNEQAILVDENTMARPDKIVIKADDTIIIDFKTGIPGSKDEKQIKKYQGTLETMGYPNVSCYLYYSSIGELRQIS